MLSKPTKPKSGFSGISSDDFSATSPLSPPDLPPRQRQLDPSISIKTTEENKPLPVIKSPEELISPKETISSLLPPILQKIESGDKNAIRNLVESSFEEIEPKHVDNKEPIALPSVPLTVEEPLVVSAEVDVQTLEEKVVEDPVLKKVEPQIVKATVFVQELDEEQSAVTHELSERIEVNEEESSKTLGESVQYLNTKEIDELISELTSGSEKNDSPTKDASEISTDEKIQVSEPVEVQPSEENHVIDSKESIQLQTPNPRKEQVVVDTITMDVPELKEKSIEPPETELFEETVLEENTQGDVSIGLPEEQSIELETRQDIEKGTGLEINTTVGVTVTVDDEDEEELDDTNAQNLLQDLLFETDQMDHPSTTAHSPRTPRTPKSPRTPRSLFLSPTKLDVSIQTDSDTLDDGCQTEPAGTGIEMACQTDADYESGIQTAEMAVSPILAHSKIDAEQQTDNVSDAGDNDQFVQLLQEENMRLVQELETLKLMVTQAKSQAQQMKILKEAAEARFEQLARVAHRKLVRAMAENKKQ
jgi:hypothetical protein